MADDTPQSYEALRVQLTDLGRVLTTPADDGADESCIDSARNLVTLADSYESKFGRTMRASLQRTVARSVAHSLARQLQVCRVHRKHRCPVNRALVQLVQKLPAMPPQDLPSQCLVARVVLQTAGQLRDAQTASSGAGGGSGGGSSVADVITALDYDVNRIQQAQASQRVPLATPRMVEEAFGRRRVDSIGPSPGELPAGWSKEISRGTGKEYYYNTVANLTQWERPTQSAYDQVDDSAAEVESALPTTPGYFYGDCSDEDPHANARAARFRRNSRNRARSELSNEIAQAEIALLRKKSAPIEEEEVLEAPWREGQEHQGLDLMTWIQEALLATMRGPVGVLLRNWYLKCYDAEGGRHLE